MSTDVGWYAPLYDNCYTSCFKIDIVLILSDRCDNVAGAMLKSTKWLLLCRTVLFKMRLRAPDGANKNPNKSGCHDD